MQGSAERAPRFRQILAIHPATLVRLRSSAPTAARGDFKSALKTMVEDVTACRVGLLSALAFPPTSIFRQHALYDILKGGEGYKLAWPWGLTDPAEDETGKFLTNSSRPSVFIY